MIFIFRKINKLKTFFGKTVRYYIIFLTLFLTTNLFSHTCDSQKAKCPICKSKVEFCVTMSMTTTGSYRDFQKQGFVGIHYEELINHCEDCKFSGYKSDFDTSFSKERIIEIKEFLMKYDSLTVDNMTECEIAGDLGVFLKRDNAEISNYYLIGSYLGAC